MEIWGALFTAIGSGIGIIAILLWKAVKLLFPIILAVIVFKLLKFLIKKGWRKIIDSIENARHH